MGQLGGAVALLIRWWPIAVVVVLLGTVFVAFAQCAVAELAVRVAVLLYEPDPDCRPAKREEWLLTIQEVRPAQRPGEAGSLLWAGFRSAVSRGHDVAFWQEGLTVSFGPGGESNPVGATLDYCANRGWRITLVRMLPPGIARSRPGRCARTILLHGTRRFSVPTRVIAYELEAKSIDDVKVGDSVRVLVEAIDGTWIDPEVCRG